MIKDGRVRRAITTREKVEMILSGFDLRMEYDLAYTRLRAAERRVQRFRMLMRKPVGCGPRVVRDVEDLASELEHLSARLESVYRTHSGGWRR